jgi:hypothetical protein
MPKGMEQAGQLLFPRARPALLTTHENHGIRFENVQHAYFQVPTEAYPNHGLQVLAIHPHEGLEALFRESFGNWRSCYRKLARHDLRGPEHNPGIQAASPSACRAYCCVSPVPGRKYDIDDKFRTKPVAAGRCWSRRSLVDGE